jgi:hypothetical protein
MCIYAPVMSFATRLITHTRHNFDLYSSFPTPTYILQNMYLLATMNTFIFKIPNIKYSS